MWKDHKIHGKKQQRWSIIKHIGGLEGLDLLDRSGSYDRQEVYVL